MHLTFGVMAALPSYLTRRYIAHNTINFWSGNWKKVCEKSSWQIEDVKMDSQALDTNKHFFTNWFVTNKLGYSRKKIGVEDTLFWKKHWNFHFVIWPFEILHKTKLYLWKSCKIVRHFLGINQSLYRFFLIAPENFSYFLFNPKKFHMLFLQYSWKIQVLGEPVSWLHLNRQTIDHKILRRITLKILFLE